jgi:hypothetical protein
LITIHNFPFKKNTTIGRKSFDSDFLTHFSHKLPSSGQVLDFIYGHLPSPHISSAPLSEPGLCCSVETKMVFLLLRQLLIVQVGSSPPLLRWLSFTVGTPEEDEGTRDLIPHGALQGRAHPMCVAEQKSHQFQQHLPGVVAKTGSFVLVQRVEVLFSVHEVTYEGHRKLI